jgi:methyl-accepting chemotaxis protein
MNIIHPIVAQALELIQKTNTNGLSLQDIVIMAGMMGGVLGFFHLLVNIGDRLWKKGSKVDDDNEFVERILSVYSDSIKTLITKQLEQIQQQNETIKEMITSFRASAEDSKLRHEIIMNSLRSVEKSDDNIHQKLDKLVERVFYSNK